MKVFATKKVISFLSMMCGFHLSNAFEAHEDGRITLELHRKEDRGIHPETYQRRRMQTSSDYNPDDLDIVPLNSGLGTHFAWVYAGTPPQRASVITDTGSSIMAFPCTDCQHCGDHTDKPFDYKSSKTLSHVTCTMPTFFHCSTCKQDDVCDISQAYMEGSSWKATVVEDIVYLGGENSTNTTHLRDQFGTRFMFGCQTSETGLFITQIPDGIMGLANNENHLIAKLYREKKIPNKQFSLCFGETGGSMSIGKSDTSRHKGNITYAKVINTQSHDFYGVRVKDIKIGGKSIQANPLSYTQGHIIVDSGTTDSYLPRTLATEFRNVFEQVSGLPYATSSHACKGYTEDEMSKLPTIQFVMEGTNGEDMTLDVGPERYLLKEKERFCAGIFLSEASGGVIGANIMMDRDVIFDNENQRVGFVDADCTYRRLNTNDTSANTTSISPTPIPVSSTNATTNNTSTPVPSVVNGTANTTSSTTNSSMTLAPTPLPVTNATTVAPSTATSDNSTPNVTNSTSEAPTATPTAVPTEPVTVKPVATTEAPPATATPTTTPPPSKPSTKPPKFTEPPKATVKTSKDGSLAGKEEEHPMVLTVVGSILGVGFVVAALAACRKKKGKKNSSHNWSRVNGEEEDDDDDDEFGLVDPSDRQGSSSNSRRRLSDESGSDNDLDDDDDDEFFDSGDLRDDRGRHDQRVLDRL